MKTLIQKELRENFKLALLGLAVIGLALAMTYHQYAEAYARLVAGDGSGLGVDAQPLLRDIPRCVAFIATVFGAVLGWFQIHNERHRDLWAFLLHRPLSRTKIFAGKVIAGLCLYLLAMGLPLLVCVLMIITPGHIAAPFEPAMLRPVTVCFASGLVFYFAGMLVSLRQARWYVSRPLGLGVVALIFAGLFNLPFFWQTMAMVLLGSAMLAWATWGSFLGGGYDEGMPAIGRGALALSLMFGCFIVMMGAMLLVESAFPVLLVGSSSWSRFQMTRDGTIYKETQRGAGAMQITRLDGSPLNDPHTGRPMTSEVFNRTLGIRVNSWVNFDDPLENAMRREASYWNGDAYFVWWHKTRDTLWYWNRNGRLWAYDAVSRRFAGSLGPNGFTPGVATGPDRFRPAGQIGVETYSDSAYSARTFMTANALYKVDLENRTASIVFSATNGDRIGGALDVSTNTYDWNYTVIVSEKSVWLTTPEGKPVWEIPFAPGYPEYQNVSVSFLESTNPVAVWFEPNYWTNELKHWTLPTHVAWLGADGTLANGTNLPCLDPRREWRRPVGESILFSAMPPAFYAAPILFDGKAYLRDFPLLEIRRAMVLAIVCVGIGCYLGRRNYFTLGGQLWWALFHLLFGVPGLLAFLCIQEWPARESCPECKRLRLANRERCEYCGATFAPPPKYGTEIFAPLEPAANK